jgi:hypothetical protein
MDIEKTVTVGEVAFACHWAGCGRSYRVERCLKRHQRKAGHVEDGCGTSNSGEKSGPENQRKCGKVESVTVTGDDGKMRCDWNGCGKSFKFLRDLRRHKRQNGHIGEDYNIGTMLCTVADCNKRSVMFVCRMLSVLIYVDHVMMGLQLYTVGHKKHTKMFFTITFIKLGRF